jgi:hypothetical protein
MAPLQMHKLASNGSRGSVEDGNEAASDGGGGCM